MEGNGNFNLQSTPRVPCYDTHSCGGGGNNKGNRIRILVVCEVNRLVRTDVMLLKVICTLGLPISDWIITPCRKKWTCPFSVKKKTDLPAGVVTWQLGYSIPVYAWRDWGKQWKFWIRNFGAAEEISACTPEYQRGFCHLSLVAGYFSLHFQVQIRIL